MGKLVLLMITVGLAAYGQHGHAGGGSGLAGHMPGDSGGAVSGTHGQPGTMDRTSSSGLAKQQSPETILHRDTKLASKLDGLLPNGMTAQQACSGFKNLGGCVSAIHVSHNLGIPFDDLKSKLTGTSPEKLGQAIHEMKPNVDAKAEAKKGQKQSSSDLTDVSDQPPIG